MQKHLFLTGPACCGKSEMIKSALGSRLAYAGGYVIVRAGVENGAPPGCDLLPAAAVAGVEGYESASILSFSGTRLTHDNEVFREAGVHLLEEAGYYPFAVLDEIGGFELIIPQFRNALLELLNSDLPCIGVLKSVQDAEMLRGVLGLGEKYTAYAQALHAALDKDTDTLVLETTGTGDTHAQRIVEQWAKEYAM